ncbi:MAG: PIG-L family deacetylase [Firmicutes bacterium]|nr:PIG-L family deacetylase [Bacillota bacterium]
MTFDMIRQLLRLPSLLEVPSLLAVEPHPDDNEVGAGATIKLLTERGATVRYITVTDGRAGSEDTHVRPEALAAMRAEERQRANQLLGVTASDQLGFEDAGAWNEDDLIRVLVPLIRQWRPAAVMTVDAWTPYESHPDHWKTGRAVSAAVIYAKNGVVQRGEGEPYEVPQVIYYGSAYPNTYVDVSETWAVKLAAMKAHASQFDNAGWDLLSQFLTEEATRLYREQYGADRVGQVEAFKVLSSLQLHFFPQAMRS